MFFKKGVLSLIILAILLSSVHAIRYTAELEPVIDKIPLEGAAEFKLTINNIEPDEHIYRIKMQDYPRWDVYTDPRVNPILITLPPFTEDTLTLFIDPNQNYIGKSGSHFVNLEVLVEGSTEKIKLQPKIGIISDLGQTDYVPTVILDTNFPDEITPNEALTFTITLTNQNNLNITKAKLRISSQLMDEEITVSLWPKEEKVVDVRIPLDSKSKPIKDILTISLMYKDKNVFTPFVKSYEVIPYSTLTDTSEMDLGFLKREEILTFVNEGNIPFQGQFRAKVNFLRNLFSSTDPKAKTIKEDGQTFYVWETTLQPYETSSVRIVENYLGITIFVLAAILIIVLVALKKSPIALEKTVTSPEVIEGGLSKLKIIVNVKNRSKHKLTHIAIIDKVPKLLNIQREAILGSLKPSKIRQNQKHETLVLWELEELEAGDERVITYHIRSKLKILGGLTLQRAMAHFQHNNKEYKPRSNIVQIRI
ncbi:hypothetical protein GOV09_02050 [Candidatus Woesearchaeota archaeon]|nr:hypothetical protein [Candidatus Woesearchaeota archaeon]